MKIILFLALISIALIPCSVLADGGVFVDYDQYVYLPEQKAAIFWDGTNETLILSTKIKSENLTNMAWVIPLPSKTKPEIEEGEIAVFYELAWVFAKYEDGSTPRAVILLFGLSVASFIASIIYMKRRRKGLFILFFISSLVLFSGMLYVSMDARDKLLGGTKEVEPIEIKEVDIYDVAILKATNATALVGWLNENGYIVPESTIPVLQDYCNKENFYFVANKINLENRYNTTAERSRVLSELRQGIATPLKITFQPDEPFYPQKISSINDGTTYISVYVVSPSPVTDKSGILSVYETKSPGSLATYHRKYESYYVTLLKYYGELETLQADSIFS